MTAAQGVEDYDSFDAFEPADSSGDDCDELEGAIYSDFNVLRSDDSGSDVDIFDEDYSFDSFETGRTFTSEDGANAIKLLLEFERKAEVSYAPGIA